MPQKLQWTIEVLTKTIYREGAEIARLRKEVFANPCVPCVLAVKKRALHYDRLYLFLTEESIKRFGGRDITKRLLFKFLQHICKFFVAFQSRTNFRRAVQCDSTIRKLRIDIFESYVRQFNNRWVRQSQVEIIFKIAD